MSWHRIIMAILASVLGVSLGPAEPVQGLPALPDGWRVYVWYEPITDMAWWGQDIDCGVHEIVLVTTTATSDWEAAAEVAEATDGELQPFSEPTVITAEDIRRDWAEAVRTRCAAETEHPTVKDLLWLWDLRTEKQK